MSSCHEENTGAVVALVSGAIIGVAAALLLMRMQNKRGAAAETAEDDYCFDGGDIFI